MRWLSSAYKIYLMSSYSPMVWDLFLRVGELANYVLKKTDITLLYSSRCKFVILLQYTKIGQHGKAWDIMYGCCVI